MDEHITAREFDERMRALTDVMTDGFSGVHKRVNEVKDELRSMNSKVANQQVAITQLSTRSAAQEVLGNEHKRKLEKIDTVAGYRHARKDDPEGDDKPLTMGDVKTFITIAKVSIILTVGAALVVMAMLFNKVGAP